MFGVCRSDSSYFTHSYHWKGNGWFFSKSHLALLDYCSSMGHQTLWFMGPRWTHGPSISMHTSTKCSRPLVNCDWQQQASESEDASTQLHTVDPAHLTCDDRKIWRPMDEKMIKYYQQHNSIPCISSNVVLAYWWIYSSQHQAGGLFAVILESGRSTPE